MVEPIAINNVGQVVSLGASPSTAVIRWEPDDVFTTIGSVSGCDPQVWYPRAMNDLGHIAGTAICPQEQRPAIIWRSPDDVTRIGNVPGGYPSTTVAAINDSGQVVGWGSSGSSTQGFYYDPATGMLPVGLWLLDINGAGVAIGAFQGGFGLWTLEDGFSSILERIGPTELPIAGVQAINERGQLLGSGLTKDGLYRVFSWDPIDGITWLPPVTKDSTETQSAWAFNDVGWITGIVATSDGYRDYFLWDARRGARLIRDLLDPCRPPPVTLTAAAPLNNSGWILGLTNYPSPTTLLLPYFPGDLDEDMDVDLSDLTRLLSNFGTTSGATYATGDVEGCDGDVDLDDLLTLLTNFGETFP